MMKIGIDFGGVLAPSATPPEGDYLRVKPFPGALLTIGRWRESGYEPHIISKASDQGKVIKAEHWLSHYGFVDVLGRKAIHFCETQEGKVPLCRQGKIGIMIDDTPDQLVLLKDIVPHLVLFGGTEQTGFVLAKDWRSVDRVVEDIANHRNAMP